MRREQIDNVNALCGETEFPIGEDGWPLPENVVDGESLRWYALTLQEFVNGEQHGDLITPEEWRDLCYEALGRLDEVADVLFGNDLVVVEGEIAMPIVSHAGGVTGEWHPEAVVQGVCRGFHFIEESLTLGGVIRA